MTLQGKRPIWVAWLISRSALLLLGPLADTAPEAFAHMNQHIAHDVGVYEGWSRILADGRFPATDPRWQYPPLAAPVIIGPRLIPLLDYHSAFVLLALLADLAVLLLLLRRDGPASAWTWTIGLALLGPTVHHRYDLFVTCCAVAALLTLNRPHLSGFHAATGTLLKAWPVLLLFALPRDRRAIRFGTAFAATSLAALALGTAFGPGSLGFLSGQRARGIEIEAIAATPWQIARLLGHPTKIVHQYGCAQFTRPGMHTLALLCQAATLAGLGLLAFTAWRRPPKQWTPCAGSRAALAALLISIITSRVLSPQYLIWIIGITAVAFPTPHRRDYRLLITIAAAALLTQIVFPLTWHQMDTTTPSTLAVTALIARNALLVTATLLTLHNLHTQTSNTKTTKDPTPGIRQKSDSAT